MGLADEVATFHRINRVTVFSPSRWELSFPKRPGMPDHGATVSRLQQNELFYLQSRGIAADQASRLLLRGYCDEVLRELPAAAASAHPLQLLLRELP